MPNYLVIGGDLDGQKLSGEHTDTNPLCSSKWYYGKHEIKIEKESGEVELIYYFCPDHWSLGMVIKALLKGYKS